MLPLSPVNAPLGHRESINAARPGGPPNPAFVGNQHLTPRSWPRHAHRCRGDTPLVCSMLSSLVAHVWLQAQSIPVARSALTPLSFRREAVVPALAYCSDQSCYRGAIQVRPCWRDLRVENVVDPSSICSRVRVWAPARHMPRLWLTRPSGMPWPGVPHDSPSSLGSSRKS